MGIYEELEWRGLIKDVSSPEIKEKLNKGGLTFYIGTDPTGDSLHIGHFSSFLISKRLKERKKLDFFELFDVKTKEYVVVTFLAVLELVSKGKMKIVQENNFDNIICEAI